MAQVFRAGRFGLLVALFLLGIGAALAAPDKPAAAPAPFIGAVGVIELDIVTREYVGWKKAQTLLEAYYKGHQGILDELEAKGIGLEKEEFTEYQTLAGSAVKVNPVRIEELEKKAKVVRDEYDGLRAKATPTEAEKTRLADLNKLFNTTVATLNEKRDAYDKQYNERAAAYTRSLLAQLDKTLADVAVAKKLAIVVSKDIQVPDPATQRVRTERFVIWGGTDVTADVVKILNDGFKDSMLEIKPQ
jgi:Skp family chaperone for outer membrane proteins